MCWCLNISFVMNLRNVFNFLLNRLILLLPSRDEGNCKYNDCSESHFKFGCRLHFNEYSRWRFTYSASSLGTLELWEMIVFARFSGVSPLSRLSSWQNWDVSSPPSERIGFIWTVETSFPGGDENSLNVVILRQKWE